MPRTQDYVVEDVDGSLHAPTAWLTSRGESQPDVFYTPRFTTATELFSGFRGEVRGFYVGGVVGAPDGEFHPAARIKRVVQTSTHPDATLATASSGALDKWGEVYRVPRLRGEPDQEYRERLIRGLRWPTSGRDEFIDDYHLDALIPEPGSRVVVEVPERLDDASLEMLVSGLRMVWRAVL